MQKILLAVTLTLVITYLVPLPVYGTLYVLAGLEFPGEGSPIGFMVAVFVMKLGVAVAFVLLYSIARNNWIDRPITYALVWWAMFALIEAGQAITPTYSWLAALGGIVSEAIYFPASTLVVARIFRPARQPHFAGQ